MNNIVLDTEVIEQIILDHYDGLDAEQIRDKYIPDVSKYVYFYYSVTDRYRYECHTNDGLITLEFYNKMCDESKKNRLSFPIPNASEYFGNVNFDEIDFSKCEEVILFYMQQHGGKLDEEKIKSNEEEYFNYEIED